MNVIVVLKAIAELLELYVKLLGFLVIMPIKSPLNTHVFEMYKLTAFPYSQSYSITKLALIISCWPL